MSWSDARKAALRSAAELWPLGQVMVIGAAGLEALQDFRRATRDVDIVVSASAQDIETRLRDAGWIRDPRIPHRWSTPAGELMDVIPAAPDLLTAGWIKWPDGRVMNLAGIALAFRAAEEVTLGDGMSIVVAPLSVQPLLKIAAYLDRPLDRTKDIGDVVALLRDSLEIWDCEVDEVADLQLSVDLACAYTIGRRLGNLTGADEARIIDEFMRKARDPADRDRTRDAIARCGRWLADENDYEDVMPLLGAFMQGFDRSRREHEPP